MSWLVLVSAPADRQIRQIDAWWRGSRDKAPELFTAQLRWAIDFLSETPLLGSPVQVQGRSLRRLLLRKTSYFIYYDVDERDHKVRIRAVWHAERGRTPQR